MSDASWYRRGNRSRAARVARVVSRVVLLATLHAIAPTHGALAQHVGDARDIRATRPTRAARAARAAQDGQDARIQRVDGARRIVDPEWISLWKAGGSSDDELFGAPRELLASDSGVYVLDAGALQLLSFSHTGALRWRVGGRGEGPGQFRRPIDFALDRNGDIAVLDPDNARITLFAPNGVVRRTVTSPSAVPATSMCINRAGQIYLIVQSVEAFVFVIDGAGARTGTVQFPFGIPRDAPPFARAAMFARGPAARRCAFVTSFAFGLGFYEPGVAPRVAPFVEPLAKPTFATEKLSGNRVRTTLTGGANAALAAIAVGDSLLVPFSGATRGANAIADLYDARGAYLETWRMPCPLPAYHAPWLYCLFNVQETPRLMAFVARADTTRVLRALQRPARSRQAGRSPESR